MHALSGLWPLADIFHYIRLHAGQAKEGRSGSVPLTPRHLASHTGTRPWRARRWTPYVKSLLLEPVAFDPKPSDSTPLETLSP